MNKVDLNLKKLQEQMKKDNIKSYVIFSTDYHNSEYCHEFYLHERLAYSAFTGTDGTLLVTQDNCYIYTDGRYWVQADIELKNTNCELRKDGHPDCKSIYNYIRDEKLYPCAFDYRCITKNQFNLFRGIETIDKSYSNLLNDYPNIEYKEIWKLRDDLIGESFESKKDKLVNFIKENEADGLLITSLDDIAYVLNARSSDIENNPVFYSYLYVSKDGDYKIFIKDRKHPFDSNHILSYDNIDSFLSKLGNKTILLDGSKVNKHLCDCIKGCIKEVTNPTLHMKAVKNDVEINNTKRAHVLDGIAMLKFINFLNKNIKKNLTEYEYSMQLKEFRLEEKECFDLSFPTIAAFKENGPMMHYEPTKDNTKVVDPKYKSVLLVDSGGQYYGGTTDITRTFYINGEDKVKLIDEDENYKKIAYHYTLTLKSLINLSRAIFMDGCSGVSLDILARGYMWNEGLDYKCGTGHGVGYMLNVHEAPNGFRYKTVKDRNDGGKLVPGMITTVEPGVYLTNKYGIRIENELLCKLHLVNDNGTFYSFETITYCPFESKLILVDMLSEDELNFVNEYHLSVRKILKEELNKQLSNNLILQDYYDELVSTLVNCTKPLERIKK